MGRARTAAIGVAAALVLAGGAAVALSVAGVVDLPGGWRSGTDTPTPDSPRDPQQVEPPPELSLPDPRQSDPVLAPVHGPGPDPAAVRDRLAPLLRDPDLGAHAGVLVRDLVRDEEVLSAGGADPYVPASTLKLFTAAAVLAVLGPDHRFGTEVLLAGAGAGPRAGPPTAVLVGGGDPLLATRRPEPGAADVPTTVSLAGLAADTARTLGRDGVRRVRVGVDGGLFIGPPESPQWEPQYVPEDVVSPISALWVEEGRVAPDGVERSSDPARAAGEAFAAALGRHGVAVVGSTRTVPAPDGAGATVLAEGLGAPLDSVVQHVLEASDNEGAEVLLRHVALGTERPGSFAGGAAAVREVLTGLGVPWAGVRTYDGSGLSRDNRVTRAALGQVLQLGADPDRPDLRTVTSGLPVARFTGSLEDRFLGPDASAGRGVVRAKTGTLSRVHGLAGTTVTRDGTLLGFGLLTDRVQLVDTLDARAVLDEMAAALAGCGCAR